MTKYKAEYKSDKLVKDEAGAVVGLLNNGEFIPLKDDVSIARAVACYSMLDNSQNDSVE